MKRKLLIKNVTLVTFFNDGYNAIKIVNTDILTEDGIIKSIDRDIQAGSEAECEVLDGKGKIAIPGLINSKSRCLASRVSRSIAEDIDCGKYGNTPMYTRVNPFVNIALELLDDEELEKLLEPSVYEAIESGTTTLIEHAQGRELNAYLKLCEKYGLRTLAAPMLMNKGKLPEADAWKNYENYPSENKIAEGIFSIEETLALAEKYKDNDLIDVCFGLGTADTVTEDLVKEVVRAANSSNKHVMIPVNETAEEIARCVERENLRPTEFFRKHHALTEKSILSGFAEVSEEDKRIIKSMGSHVVSCQHQIMLDGMLPPFIEFLVSDINTATGTGRCSVNMLEELTISAIAGKIQTGRRQQMQAPDAFYAATQAGADILGIPAGRLEEGCVADIVLIDCANPAMHPIAMPVQEIVYHTKTSDISDVIVGGKIVKRDGVVLGANTEEIISGAEMAMEKVWNCARDCGVL